MNERKAFLAALKANEDDTATRMVYADWLDEHDEPEEAERQRKWPAAKAWLREFARSINYREYKMGEDGECLEDEHGEPILTGRREENNPHTYADIIEAGYAAVSGDGYCFGTDAGSDFFFPWRQDEKEQGKKNRAEFFRNWSIVTGVPVPEDVVKRPSFRCAC